MEKCRHEYGGSVCGQPLQEHLRSSALGVLPLPKPQFLHSTEHRCSLEGRQGRAESSKYSLVLLELADEGQDLGRIMHRVLWHSAAAAGCGDGDPSGSSTALKGGSCSPTQTRERSIWLCQFFCL